MIKRKKSNTLGQSKINKRKEIMDWCKLVFWITTVLFCIYLWGYVLKVIFDYFN